MTTIERAKRLLQWNRKNLVHDAVLNKGEIGDYFAPVFQVKANGRTYDANYDNYFDFLNQFRATIRSIHYDLHELIEDKNYAVLAMTAHIIRTSGVLEKFEAILILKFDAHGKITLWHEVYFKIA
ncbi:MAG TPA: nuclear transport factor 2 family protein [Chlamydiales bacterium]|nr:nuclear transport factor 2 family protein [Chlamydiales bacterium]